ncbi:MAG: quinol monooxygenase YgiN [Glaciecola sp.]|jgi:quinol monooxygenase YgiN
MITRIVKLSFVDSYCEEFETEFPKIQKIVLSSNGCKSVELLRSSGSGTYFTYSLWIDKNCLNSYRKSDTFKKIWATFKVNFKDKAEAWSTINISPIE